jgi:hypothetical protein
MENTKTYIGYIVDKNKKNPYPVWIPTKNGFTTMGSKKGFGSNTGNMTLLDLGNMRMAADNCYYTSEMSSQPPYLYDSSNGYATREEHIAVLDENTAKNVKDKTFSANRYSMPGANEDVMTPHGNPAVNFLQTFYPMPQDGTRSNYYMNSAGGNFVTLAEGTKVLVIFPEGKGVGYIIRVIPDLDEISRYILRYAE